LGGVARSHFIHKIAIEHCLAHLLLLDVSWLVEAEAANLCLIKYLFLSSCATLHIRQHFVNARIIGRLEHNASMSGVHFINAQRSICCI